MRIGDDKASIFLRKVRDVTEMDKQHQPLLQGADGVATAPAIFSDDPLFYEATCSIAAEITTKLSVGGARPSSLSSPPPRAMPEG